MWLFTCFFSLICEKVAHKEPSISNLDVLRVAPCLGAHHEAAIKAPTFISRFKRKIKFYSLFFCFFKNNVKFYWKHKFVAQFKSTRRRRRELCQLMRRAAILFILFSVNGATVRAELESRGRYSWCGAVYTYSTHTFFFAPIKEFHRYSKPITDCSRHAPRENSWLSRRDILGQALNKMFIDGIRERVSNIYKIKTK